MSLFGTHLVSIQYEQFASLSQSTQHPRNTHSNEIHTKIGPLKRSGNQQSILTQVHYLSLGSSKDKLQRLQSK